MVAKFRFWIGVVLLAANGCAGGPRPIGGAPNLTVLDAKALPVPAADAKARPYAIGPLDKLQINVLGIDELTNLEIQVDPTGHISLPLAGTIDVKGKLASEAQADIVEALRRAHVRRPVVSVNYREMLSQTYSIDGEVKRPGIYPAPQDLTLLQATARGEGFTDTANLQDVVVFRTVEGQRYAALFNLGAIRRGAYDDPFILPGDVIEVGNSKGRRLFLDLLQIVPLLTTPLIVAIRK